MDIVFSPTFFITYFFRVKPNRPLDMFSHPFEQLTTGICPLVYYMLSADLIAGSERLECQGFLFFEICESVYSTREITIEKSWVTLSLA